MKPYFYVYQYSNKAPRVRHATIEQAQAEAERLARENPGGTFEILKAVGITRCTQASTFWTDSEEPPEKPRYRKLEIGEVIAGGDEFNFRQSDEWRPHTTWIGMALGHDHYPTRRPL